MTHHQANDICRNHFVKRLQVDDIRSVQLVVTTRHATTYKKLSEGQQTEKKSGRNQKLQILNIQNMLIFAGSRNKPRHDEENHQKRSCA